MADDPRIERVRDLSDAKDDLRRLKDDDLARYAQEEVDRIFEMAEIAQNLFEDLDLPAISLKSDPRGLTGIRERGDWKVLGHRVDMVPEESPIASQNPDARVMIARHEAVVLGPNGAMGFARWSSWAEYFVQDEEEALAPIRDLYESVKRFGFHNDRLDERSRDLQNTSHKTTPADFESRGFDVSDILDTLYGALEATQKKLADARRDLEDARARYEARAQRYDKVLAQGAEPRRSTAPGIDR